MAGNAQGLGLCLACCLFRVTRTANKVRVRTRQRIARLTIMIEFPILPAARVMTISADRT